MARSYYRGLNTTAGMAEGIQAGFGLVNDAYAQRDALALDREKLAQDKKISEAEMRMRTRELGIEERRADEAAEANRIAREEAVAESEFRRQTSLSNAAINRARADTAATQARTAELQQEGLLAQAGREAEESERQRRLMEATAGLNDLAIMAAAPAGTYTLEQFQAAMEATEGTVLDVNKILSVPVQESIANMTSEIGRGLNSGDLDLNNPAVLDGLTTIFDSQRGRLKGKTIDGSFPNAPEAYKDGNWTVLDRIVSSAEADPNNPAMLGATVGVVIQHKDTGEVAYYDAPLTVNRDPSGDPAAVDFRQAIEGVAGVSMLVQDLNSKRDFIEQRLIQSKFKSDTEFNGAVEGEIARLQEQKESGRPLIAGKPNESIGAMEIRALARSNVLGLQQAGPDFRADRQRQILTARDLLKPTTDRASMPSIDAQGNTVRSPFEFTDSQILKIASTLDEKQRISPSTEKMIREMVENAGGTFMGNTRTYRNRRSVQR